MVKKYISKSEKKNKIENKKHKKNRSISIKRQKNKYQIKNNDITRHKYNLRSRNPINSINIINNQIIDPSIRELIRLLDDSSIRIKEPILPFELNFPCKLNAKEFKELFIRGLKNAKKTFNSSNLKALKTILNKVLNLDKNNGKDGFEFLLSQNELEKAYKMDFLLTIVSDQKNVEKIKNNNVSFEKSFEYNLYSNRLFFEKVIEYNKNIQGPMDIKHFESILYSNTVLKCYSKMFDKLYGKKIDCQEIKQALIDFRKNHQIFFIEMKTGVYGFIVYDGTIFINDKYYSKICHESTDIFIVFVTLLHEYSHILSRLLRGDKNYFNDTGEFLKNKNNNLSTDESGKYFEDLFLFSVLNDTKLTSLECDYLLNEKNYTYSNIEDFQSAFLIFRSQNYSKIKKQQAVQVSKQNSSDGVEIKIKCYFAGSRV